MKMSWDFFKDHNNGTETANVVTKVDEDVVLGKEEKELKILLSEPSSLSLQAGSVSGPLIG